MPVVATATDIATSASTAAKDVDMPPMALQHTHTI